MGWPSWTIPSRLPARPQGTAPRPHRGPCTNLFINLSSTSGSAQPSVRRSSPCCCPHFSRPCRRIGVSYPHIEPRIPDWGTHRILIPRERPQPWDPASLLVGPSASPQAGGPERMRSMCTSKCREARGAHQPSAARAPPEQGCGALLALPHGRAACVCVRVCVRVSVSVCHVCPSFPLTPAWYLLLWPGPSC